MGEYAQKRGVAVCLSYLTSLAFKYSQLGKLPPLDGFLNSREAEPVELFTTLGGQVERYQKEYVSYTVYISTYPHVIFAL
jgi:hypothetical protein